MHISLEQHIRKFCDLGETEVSVLNNCVKYHKFKKKEFLLSEGKVCKDLYFINKGCLRMFFLNNKSIEQFAKFALDGWWITDYQSFLNNAPSEYYIQTIEDTEFVIFVLIKHF